jgi:hypothetical protein
MIDDVPIALKKELRLLVNAQSQLASGLTAANDGSALILW